METPADGAPKLWRRGTLVYTLSGLVFLFCWLLLGDFAWQLKERSVSDTARLVLRNFAASDLLVGLLIGSLPGAFAMIIGPVISVKSDRHRGRWGRRIPFLLVPLPAVVISMTGLAISPWLGAHLHDLLGGRSPGLNNCVLVTFAVCWAFFEIASILANATFGGLINDTVPQEVIGRFYALFRMVSLIDGIIFNRFLIKHAEHYFFWIFIGGGLLYGIGFTLMCVMVKEGEYPPVEPLDETARPGRFQAIRSYLRECFATPYYLWLFLALILCSLSFSPVNSFSLFYARSIGMSTEDYGGYIWPSYACSLTLAYPLGWLADRIHPLRLGIASILLYAVVTLWGAAFAITPRTFGYAFMAHTFISGTYMTAMASVGQRLYPKLKFAQFASASGLLDSVCRILLPSAMGLILDANGHNYRITFLVSGLFSSFGFVALVVVHRKFMQLGGPGNYIAPHVQPPDPV